MKKLQVDNNLDNIINRIRNSKPDYLDSTQSGVVEPNTTQFPNELLDFWIGILTPYEFVVLAYIVRKTYGYKKATKGDEIALSQIQHGTVSKTGKQQDLGTRLSKDVIISSIKKLEKLGLIDVIREGGSDNKAKKTNKYRLVRKPVDDIESEILSIGKVVDSSD